MTMNELRMLMTRHEDEHVEFKEAKTQIDLGDLFDYCIAMANEGGGHLVLGISNKQPRRIVGSTACRSIPDTKSSLFRTLGFRVDIEEIRADEGRVVVLSIPSRPVGQPLQLDGRYLMRSGESLAPMTPDMLRRIFDEARPDFSADICRDISLTDLDAEAMVRFREMWATDSGNREISDLSVDQLLHDAELATDDGITYAALILLGTHRAFGKCLGHAEVIYEYRPREESIEYTQRREFREGFIKYFDDLLEMINARNEVTQYQEGFVKLDIPMFRETVVREAILNAIAHRDYRTQGSIFVRQFPRTLEIRSPGGFPPGITAANILDNSKARNQRIAMALQKCGLVERAGQGANIMFRDCIRDSKPLPDYTGTDDYRVVLTLRGEVQDPQFIQFLNQIADEKGRLLATGDLLVLDLVHREERMPRGLVPRLRQLVEDGIIEKVGLGRGRSFRYILSSRFYRFAGKSGIYTRKRGLDREMNKELLFRHIRDNKEEGARLGELLQVLRDLTREQVKGLLRELKDEGRIVSIGRTSAGRWYPASPGRETKP